VVFSYTRTSSHIVYYSAWHNCSRAVQREGCTFSDLFTQVLQYSRWSQFNTYDVTQQRYTEALDSLQHLCTNIEPGMNSLLDRLVKIRGSTVAMAHYIGIQVNECNRQLDKCIVWKYSPSQKYHDLEIWVMGYWRLSKLVPFDSLPVVSHYCPTGTVQEIASPPVWYNCQNHGGLAFIHSDCIRFQKKQFDISISTFEYLCGLPLSLRAARRLLTRQSTVTTSWRRFFCSTYDVQLLCRCLWRLQRTRRPGRRCQRCATGPTTAVVWIRSARVGAHS